METLPHDIIFIIKEYLDPVSYICLLEIGSRVINRYRDSNDKKQYKNKQIKYFKNRGLDINSEASFLSLEDDIAYKISEPGDYIIVSCPKPVELSIKGNGINLYLNKKVIVLKEGTTLNIDGSNISMTDGYIEGYYSNVISVNNCHKVKISQVDVTLYYMNFTDSFGVILSGSDLLLDSCRVRSINLYKSRDSETVVKTQKEILIIKKRYPKRYYPRAASKNNYQSNMNKIYQKINKRPMSYKNWKR